MFLRFLWPLTFDCSQPRSASDSQPPETSIQSAGSAASEADVQLSPTADGEQEVPFTEVHTQLAPSQQEEEVPKKIEEEEEEKEEKKEEEEQEEQEERRVGEEGVSEAYALSSTLCVEEKEEEQQADGS